MADQGKSGSLRRYRGHVAQDVPNMSAWTPRAVELHNRQDPYFRSAQPQNLPPADTPGLNPRMTSQVHPDFEAPDPTGAGAQAVDANATTGMVSKQMGKRVADALNSSPRMQARLAALSPGAAYVLRQGNMPITGGGGRHVQKTKKPPLM